MVARHVAVALALGLCACITDPQSAGSPFEGIVTSRAPRLVGIPTAAGVRIDSLPAMVVEVDPTEPVDPRCSNVSHHGLGAVQELRFSNGLPAHLSDLVIGARVRVWWSGVQNDSCPPQRGADRVVILSRP